VSIAVKGKKSAPKAASKKAAVKKTTSKKTTAKNTGRKKAAAKNAAPRKKAALRKPRQVETPVAGPEVRRKFSMTVQVSGREFMDDPVAATRRVLILALTQIPAKIHQEQIDSEGIQKGMFNKRAETHFNGVLNDPKNSTTAGAFHSFNVWEWRPADR
jgi:hypothetical protein